MTSSAAAASLGPDESTASDLNVCRHDEHRVMAARIAHLETALRSNRQIGMAIGIVMTTHHLAADAAFSALATLSQDRNVKLHTIADELVARRTADIGGSATGTASSSRTGSRPTAVNPGGSPDVV